MNKKELKINPEIKVQACLIGQVKKNYISLVGKPTQTCMYITKLGTDYHVGPVKNFPRGQMWGRSEG